MIKKIWNFITRQPEIESPKEELAQGRSIFSTHDLHDDPIIPGKSRLRIWDAAMEKLASAMPIATQEFQEGTAMDAAQDGGSSLKQAYALSQPNISDTLMMWYVSQSFIGHQLCAFLSQHWLINKACTMPARDAIRQGYEIVSADGEKLPVEILQEIKRWDDEFRLNGNMMRYVRFGRIFGIRVLFFKVDSPDPEYYEKPFNLDGITPGSYKGIVQCDPYWTAPMLDINSSSRPDNIHFYEPTWWMINGKKYHRTHLIIFRPNEVADILKPSYLYGGVPVPQQIMERVYAAERTANEAPLLAMTKRTTVFSTNIQEAYANKDNFDQKMQEWIAMRDNQQIKIADKEADKVEQFDTSMAELDNVIMTQYQIVAAASNVPATKLLGTTPKGFNATGEAEESSYHEELESIQTHDLNPLTLRHHQLIVRSFIRPKFGIDCDVRVHWNPLDSPTAQEEADINLKKAQTGQALIDSGAIDGIDERDRLIADPSSGYTQLAAAMRPEEPEEDAIAQDAAEKKRRQKKINNAQLTLGV